MGYTYVEMNASCTRSKNTLKEVIAESLNNTSIKNFYAGNVHSVCHRRETPGGPGRVPGFWCEVCATLLLLPLWNAVAALKLPPRRTDCEILKGDPRVSPPHSYRLSNAHLTL